MYYRIDKLTAFSTVVMMPPVATVVFFDIETTGLPENEGNRTRITELSLVAVKREHLLNTPSRELPRVIHKLTLCLNPQRPVTDDGVHYTGLSDDLLLQEPVFNIQTLHLINCFLGVLSKPVCMVAHDGLSNDFPILKKQIHDLGLVDATLSDDLLCADSFHAFYHVMNDDFNRDNLAMRDINERTPTRPPAPAGRTMAIEFVNREPIVRLPWGAGPQPKVSYKLNEIYKRVLGRYPVNRHRAERDCIFLLEILAARRGLAADFLDWIDVNNVLFSEIIPMTVGVPLFRPRQLQF